MRTRTSESATWSASDHVRPESVWLVLTIRSRSLAIEGHSASRGLHDTSRQRSTLLPVSALYDLIFST